MTDEQQPDDSAEENSADGVNENSEQSSGESSAESTEAGANASSDEHAEELLSQEEIDTLLSGVDEGEVVTECSVVDGEAVAFDFTRQNRIVRGRMPTLEMVNERFARFFRPSLLALMQRDAEVTPQGIKVEKYSDYAASIPMPASLSWIELKPLRGAGLLVLDATLVFTLVDNFFGGNGGSVKIENRNFTATEMRVIGRVINACFDNLREAWQAVVDVQPALLGSEDNPTLSNVVSPDDAIVVSTFQIDLDGGSGEFHIALPVSMLEPIKETLDSGIQSDTTHKDERWTEVLKDELLYASVAINCCVVEKEIALRDIIDLQEGDVIPIDKPEIVRVLANGTPVLNATLGVSGDKLALQIVDRISNNRN